jgi:hypothetical protein
VCIVHNHTHHSLRSDGIQEYENSEKRVFDKVEVSFCLAFLQELLGRLTPPQELMDKAVCILRLSLLRQADVRQEEEN